MRRMVRLAASARKFGRLCRCQSAAEPVTGPAIIPATAQLSTMGSVLYTRRIRTMRTRRPSAWRARSWVPDGVSSLRGDGGQTARPAVPRVIAWPAPGILAARLDGDGGISRGRKTSDIPRIPGKLEDLDRQGPDRSSADPFPGRTYRDSVLSVLGHSRHHPSCVSPSKPAARRRPQAFRKPRRDDSMAPKRIVHNVGLGGTAATKPIDPAHWKGGRRHAGWRIVLHSIAICTAVSPGAWSDSARSAAERGLWRADPIQGNKTESFALG
jgi:hypothetical protein